MGLFFPEDPHFDENQVYSCPTRGVGRPAGRAGWRRTFRPGTVRQLCRSAFGTYQNYAVSVELNCLDSFTEDESTILTDFLNGCHYAA